MTRDEILDAIKQASAVPAEPVEYPGLGAIRARMDAVVTLADQYMDLDEADRQYLAESLRDALDRFSDLIDSHA